VKLVDLYEKNICYDFQRYNR